MDDEPLDESLKREAAKPLQNTGLREPRSFYDASPPALAPGDGGGWSNRALPKVERLTDQVEGLSGPKAGGKMKTSVYLEVADVRRLSWLAEVESRPQAEIIRDAIRAYYPKVDRDFELFKSVSLDHLSGSVLEEADILEFQDVLDELMEGFGED